MTESGIESVHPERPAERPFLAYLRSEQTIFLLFALSVGILGGLFAVGFTKLTEWVSELIFRREGSIIEIAENLPPWFRLSAPAAGGFGAGLFMLWAKRRSGSQVSMATIMEAVTLRKGLLSFRNTAIKAAASLSAIATGGSVGREGPIIQLSAAAGSKIGQLRRLSEFRVRILVACGVAAGLAGAYRTPIAAVLFVLEIVAGVLAVEMLGPIIIASVAASVVVTSFHAGPLYAVPAFHFVSSWELCFYAALGLAAGLAGPLFLASLSRTAKFVESVRLWFPLRTAIGGLAVGAIALGLPEVWGNGYPVVDRILNDASPALLALVVLFVGKLVATTCTVSSGSPGGVFTPTLVLGAALGATLGLLSNAWLEESSASVGAYALVGMAAMIGSTTHAPLTGAVMVTEMTGDYEIVLPLLLSCGIATLVARVCQRDSIYTAELRRRGIAWEGSPEQRLLQTLRAQDIMRSDVEPISANTPYQKLVDRFSATRVRVIYVVDQSGQYLGAIDLHAVKGILEASELGSLLIASELVQPTPAVEPDATLALLNERLWLIDNGELPVVSKGHFQGVVTRRDLLGAIDREILRRDMLVARFGWRDQQGQRHTDYVELPEGQEIQRVAVPAWMAGRTLGQVDIRGRFGVNVVAIVVTDAEGNETRRPPKATEQLARDEDLIVLGARESLAAFQLAQ
ncbi:MAG: chloride channel protein [Planctomycetota bacterium]